MNNLARISNFLDQVSPVEAKPNAGLRVTSNQEFKKEFNRQINANSKKAEHIKEDQPQQVKADKPDAVNQQAKADQSEAANQQEQQSNLQLTAEQNQQSEIQQEVSQVSETKVTEIVDLPLSDELRTFFADLTKEEADELLTEISQWLSQLSPDELDELLASLETSPEAMFSLMPANLQNLVADMAQANTQTLTRVHQLITGLVNSKADLNQLAGIQLNQTANQQAASLSLVQQANTETANKEEAKPLPAATTNLSLVSNKDDKAKEDVLGKSSSKNTKTRVQELIANLNKASQAKAAASKTAAANAASFNSTNASPASKEGLNQLLQAASQGLSQNVNSASQLNAARSMPLMMQAAANANAQALANRLSIMQAQNMKVAEMRLDPPNLGKVRIQIRMTGEQASINITAANPQARDLLEQALPRLKEMLGDGGIDLADAQVFDDSNPEDKTQEQQELSKNSLSSTSNNQETEDLLAAEENIHYFEEPLGLIDYYA